ncbi:MAG TPA: ABC transporter permease [Saprospiraceae bacterium]|nr:ABC transporter permease [Saprospiraceae bacterium]HMQ85915.1 ABC transporter permease [Saprospiraceae bacterium]
MDKLLLIIKREYLTRVKRWSFILATILTPLSFAIFFIVIGFIFEYESDDVKRIAVIDSHQVLNKSISDGKNLYFKFIDQDLETMRRDFDQYDFDGVLFIPALKDILVSNITIYYYSDGQLSLDVEAQIKERIRTGLRKYKIAALNLDVQQLNALEIQVNLEPEPLKDSDSDATSMTGAIAAAMGGMMGVIMYLTVFIYGMMVMRSVMEEKSNRIVEVMISSVKPFQLMLGKIIGVGAVGLTQVAIWAILIPGIMLIVNLVFQFEAPAMETPAGAPNPEDLEATVALAIAEMQALNWWMIIPLFVIYFLGGYFLYASLFAAVGSAMGDDMGEGQSLTIPITIPVVIAFYIMIAVIQSPNSSLARWSSFFPLFSPIVMPARLAFNPPLWEIALSILLLAGTAVFFVWLSGRIYRVGILMYGKKITLRELGRWLFYKG